MFGALKEILGGLILFAIGWFFATSDARFIQASQPATLIVLQTDKRPATGPNNGWMFRQVLGLETDVRPRPEYSGNVWFSLPLHRLGEITAGRYDPVSGKMQTDRMLWVSWVIAWVTRILGVWLVLTGLSRLFGFRRTHE